ncbi:hypothetical protein MPSEU_000696100 [Mayamaea pseudoterrestris]|nr:hypothetical protein MPSEU_000696100 [Mayamaea pseudoterrestris]
MEENNDDIINRGDFFDPVDDRDEDDTSDDGSDEDANMMMSDDDEGWDDFIDRLYETNLKPLIQKINGDYLECNASYLWHFEENGNVRNITLSEIFLPLIYRSAARQEFITAIETKGKFSLKTLHIAYLFDDYLDDDNVSEILRCLDDLGRAFGLCEHLSDVTIYTHVDSNDREEAYTRLIRFIPHVRKLVVSITSTDAQYVPSVFLRHIESMNRLESFTFDRVNDLFDQRCIRHLVEVETMVDFTWQEGSGMGVGVREPVSKAVALELSRLFQRNRLERLAICSWILSDNEVSTTMSDSIAVSLRLKELRLGDYFLGARSNEFYGAIGQSLPRMEDLESLTLAFGCSWDRQENDGAGGVGSEQCQLAILSGAMRASSLYDVRLINFSWTDPLVTLLASYLSATTPLRRLEVKGTWERVGSTALICLKSALNRCRLKELQFTLTADSDIIGIAAGVAMNQSVERLFLTSEDFSLETISQVLHALRLNQTLKHLECITDASSQDHSCLRKGPRCTVDSFNQAYQRLTDALAANLTLECIYLWHCPGADDLRVSSSVFSFVLLNCLGRRYIRQANEPGFRQKACQFLATINSDLELVYLHLHDIPVLFER